MAFDESRPHQERYFAADPRVPVTNAGDKASECVCRRSRFAARWADQI